MSKDRKLVNYEQKFKHNSTGPERRKEIKIHEHIGPLGLLTNADS